MSAVADAVEQDGDAPDLPVKTGKKKLVILIAAAVLVAAGAGGGATVYLKKKRAAAEAAAAAAALAEGDTNAAAEAAAPKARETQHKGPPTFLPLDAFVVNLADKDTERFAQVGITLELDDAKFADQLKAYMPAIRNGILMTLSSKSSKELLTRNGKEKLALEIMREAVRPLGIELEDDADGDAPARDKDEATAAKTPIEESPVRHVHFSSFIIQ